MKKIFTSLLWMALAVTTGFAQTAEPLPVVDDAATADAPTTATADTLAPISDEPLVLPLYTPTSTFSSPWDYGFRGYGLRGFSPWSNWGAWQLHEGFNAQVGMSVSTAFGRNAPSGTGFGQNIAVAYAKTFSPRWAVAVSAYGTNMDWGSWQRKEVGVSAVVRYKANDWLNVYGYASKNIREKGSPTLFDYGLSPYYAWGSPYWLGNPSTRVGAAAEIKLGERAFLSVSFDYVKYDAPDDVAPLMKRPTYRDSSQSMFVGR